ncbi:hypothetical protein HK096_008478, partial [Nowakowskiella sp. JEL0078]
HADLYPVIRKNKTLWMNSQPTIPVASNLSVINNKLSFLADNSSEFFFNQKDTNTYEFELLRFGNSVSPSRINDIRPPGAIGFNTAGMPPKSPQLKDTSVYQASISVGVQTDLIHAENQTISLFSQKYSLTHSTSPNRKNRRFYINEKESEFTYLHQQNYKDIEVQSFYDEDSEEISLHSPIKNLEEYPKDIDSNYSEQLITHHEIYYQDELFQENSKNLNPSSDSDEYDSSNYQQTNLIPNEFPQKMSVKQPKTLLQHILFQQHNKKLEQLSLQNINPPTELPEATLKIQKDPGYLRPRTPEPPVETDDEEEINKRDSHISLFDDYYASTLDRISFDYQSTSTSPPPTQNLIGLLNASDDFNVQWWSESDRDDKSYTDSVKSISFTDDIFNEYLLYSPEDSIEEFQYEDSKIIPLHGGFAPFAKKPVKNKPSCLWLDD